MTRNDASGNASADGLARQVVTLTGWAEKVIYTGLLLSLPAILVKLTAGNELEIAGADFKVSHMWVIYLCLTLAHAYTQMRVFGSARELYRAGSDATCMSAFESVKREGGLIVNGLIPRIHIISNPKLPAHLVEMDWKDHSTWVAHGAALMPIAAIVPFEFRGLNIGNPDWRFTGVLVISVVIVIANWLIGGRWIMALSLLSVPHLEAHRTPLAKAFKFTQ